MIGNDSARTRGPLANYLVGRLTGVERDAALNAVHGSGQQSTPRFPFLSRACGDGHRRYRRDPFL